MLAQTLRPAAISIRGWVVVAPISVLIASCMYLPVSGPSDGLIAESRLRELIGENQTNVEAALSKPRSVLASDDATYSLYQGWKDFGYASVTDGRSIWYGYTSTIHYCYMLEFDQSGILKKFSVKDQTTDWQKEEWQKKGPNCSLLFWSAAEVRELARKQKELEAEARDIAKAELKVRAQTGDIDAAVELAANYHDSRPLSEIAKVLDPNVAYDLFTRVNRPLYELPEAARWLCRAANGNHADAQLKLAYWYRPDIWDAITAVQRAALTSSGIQPDVRVAYMWYTLADSNGAADAIPYRNAAAIRMTAEEVTQAEEMVHNWRPGDCPVRVNRLHQLSPGG